MGKMQTINILAVVIATIVVFVDANDLTKFPTTTLVETAKKTTAFTTTENAEINRKVANLATTNDDKAQTAPIKIIATTTTTSTVALITKNDFLSELPARTTTTATESSVRAREQKVQNDVVNYQNVSRVKAKKNAARDLVKNVEEIDGRVTGTQINTAEMLSNEQRNHGHVNDNVVQHKLLQTNEDATTTETTPAQGLLPTAIDNLEGVDGVKLAEFIVNDRHIHEHEIPIPDIKPTTTTVAAVAAATTTTSTSAPRNIADLYPLQKSDLEPITLPIVFTYKDVQTAAEYRQNLLPNEVEIMQELKNNQKQKP